MSGGTYFKRARQQHGDIVNYNTRSEASFFFFPCRRSCRHPLDLGRAHSRRFIESCPDEIRPNPLETEWFWLSCSVAIKLQITRPRRSSAAGERARWIRAQVGQTLRLIPVDDIDYLRPDAKYTLAAWRDEAGQPGEAVVRIALKDLVAQLDPGEFAQVHRSVAANLRAVSHVRRRDNETAEIHLKRRKEVLPVSRSYLHLFLQL